MLTRRLICLKRNFSTSTATAIENCFSLKSSESESESEEKSLPRKFEIPKQYERHEFNFETEC